MRLLASMVLAGCLLCDAGIQQSTAPGIVAEVREALGGERALAAISSFSIDGRGAWFSTSGRLAYSVRIDCLLPDKFVVTRLQSDGGRSITERNGVNGNDLIAQTILSPPFAMPQPRPPGVPEETPESKAAERERQLLREKQHFAAFMLSLFARSSAAYPVELVDAGIAELQETPLRLIEGRASGPSGIRLFVDPVTHLPSVASWMATQQAPALPGALTLMPPADIANVLNTRPVEHQLHVGDYKLSNGTRWPRLLIEYIDGREVEELIVRTITLNPTFPANRFEATK